MAAPRESARLSRHAIDHMQRRQQCLLLARRKRRMGIAPECAPSPACGEKVGMRWRFPLGSDSRLRPLTRIAELVIGPATSGRTRWQSDLSPRSGGEERIESMAQTILPTLLG
jgi:hypothetical protein